jgi:hypothetical protein
MKLLEKVGQGLYDHKGDIQIVGGLVGIAVGTFLMCKATYHFDEKFADVNDAKEEMQKTREQLSEEEYTKREYIEDTVHVAADYVKTGLKVYGPGIMSMIFGVGLVCAGRKTYSIRLGGALTGYQMLKTQFDGYRQRVAEKYGEEEEDKIALPREKKVVTEKIKQPDGSLKEQPKKAVVVDSRAFDEKNSWNCVIGPDNINYAVGNPDLTIMVLKGKQEEIQRLVNRRRVSLNEIYSALGLEKDDEVGAVYGYRKGGKVDFGLNDRNGEVLRKFRDEKDVYGEFPIVFHNIEPLISVPKEK